MPMKDDDDEDEDDEDDDDEDDEDDEDRDGDAYGVGIIQTRARNIRTLLWTRISMGLEIIRPGHES